MSHSTPPNPGTSYPPLHSELLLLPDGRVLVHNLTPAFARWLSSLGLPDLRGQTTPSPELVQVNPALISNPSSPKGPS